MKKIVFPLLGLLLLGGCASNDASLSSLTEPSSKDTLDREALVVYFSASGNTKKAADKIAKVLSSNAFSLEPVDPYTDEDLNYNNSNSRVSKEHLSNDRNVPLKTKTPENFDSYSQIYLGYPIWWGEASWATYEFLTGNSFEGKTIIPFATSASSPFGSSDRKLKELAPNATWKEGRRFSSNASEEEISSWVSSLNL